MTDLFALVDLLAERHALTHEEYRALVKGQTPELAAYAAKKAIPCAAKSTELISTSAGSLKSETTAKMTASTAVSANPTPIVTDISLPGSRFWNAVRKAGI